MNILRCESVACSGYDVNSGTSVTCDRDYVNITLSIAFTFCIRSCPGLFLALCMMIACIAFVFLLYQCLPEDGDVSLKHVGGFFCMGDLRFW